MQRVFRLIAVIAICAVFVPAHGALHMSAANAITFNDVATHDAAIHGHLTDKFTRAEKIFAALEADAAHFRDAFGSISDMLREEAWRQCLSLEAVHSLAARLDASAGSGGSPGIRASVADLVRDIRQLITAHLIFKALADQEGDVRRLFDLMPRADVPLNHSPIEAMALLATALEGA